MADSVYSLTQIEDWQSQLKDFAKTPRTRFSKKQAVEALIDEIETALEAHPFDEVAEKLKGWGLDIAAGSLKQYVNAYRREHGSEADSSARKRSGKKTKQKGTVDIATKQSQITASKTSKVGSESADSQDAFEKEALGNAGNRTKRTSSRTSDGFLEMAEDL